MARCEACRAESGGRVRITLPDGSQRSVCTRCAYAAAPERTRAMVQAVAETFGGGVEVENDQGVLFRLEEEAASG